MLGMWRVAFLIFFLLFSFDTLGQSNPEAHRLSTGSYIFSEWAAGQPAGSYPDNIILQQYAPTATPKEEDEPAGDWTCNYNIDTRSRFLGLGLNGLGFINTSDTQDNADRCGGNPNETGGRVGIAVLALDTRGREQIELEWKARLMSQGAGLPKPREYRLAAQYRVDSTGQWKNLPNSTRFSSLGRTAGSEARYNITLPEECNNKGYIQIRWKYYQEDGNDGGARPMIALDDIRVFSAPEGGTATPVVFASTGTLPTAGCLQGSSDNIQYFDLEGRYLRADINILAPDGFTLSPNPDGPYTPTLSIAPLSGTVFPTRIYVRSKCEEIRSYSGFLRIRSSGATDFRVNVLAETYPKLFLNEVMASNFNSLRDPASGGYPDWIEIYNPNNFRINLSNYYFSDNLNNLSKSQLRSSGNQIIEANSYRVFFATGEINAITHLNFSLSSSGERVLMIGRDGKTIIDSMSFGQQYADISYGRITDGGTNTGYFQTPNPNQTNNAYSTFAGRLSKCTFSRESGFVDPDDQLLIYPPDSNSIIVYTIDGSEPDLRNLGGRSFLYKNKYWVWPNLDAFGDFKLSNPYRSYRYFEAINLEELFERQDLYTNIATTYHSFDEVSHPFLDVEKSISIKAKAYDSNLLESEVAEIKLVSNKRILHDSLLVISLTMDPNQLYEYNKGILVAGVDFDEWRRRVPAAGVQVWATPANFRRSGRENEIPAHIAVFDKNQTYFEGGIGLRIHGRASRSAVLKGFRFYARNSIGEASFKNSNLFEHLSYSDFFRLVSKSRDDMRDLIGQQIAEGLNVYPQAFRSAIMFVNGEYYGIRYLSERQDKHYFKTRYGLDESKITLIKNTRVRYGDRNKFLSMLDFFRDNNFANDQKLAEAEALIDLDNYIDYFAAEIFTANDDWPDNNQNLWIYNEPDSNPKKPLGYDGRWRWIYFDLDGSMGARNDLGVDMFDKVLNNTCPDNWCNIHFQKLYQNPSFKYRFAIRMADLLNTSFKENRVKSIIYRNANIIRNEIQAHSNRTGNALQFENPGRWESGVVGPMISFAEARPFHIRNQLRRYFGYGNDQTLVIDVNNYDQGYIKTNTIEIHEHTPGIPQKPYPWEGTYLQGMPIQLVAIPREGFKLSYWDTPSGRQYNDTINFVMSGKVNYKANFIKDENYNYFPAPFALKGCPYNFERLEEDTPSETILPHIAFVSTKFPDSGPAGELEGFLDSISFNHSSRTRVNGLNHRGLSLINTTNANKNYLPARLGGFVLALNTSDVTAATIQWESETIKANSKAYNIRLQYRVGDRGPFRDLRDPSGNLIEYKRNANEGQPEIIGPYLLPTDLMNRPYIQLLFRYYYTGQQSDLNSEARDEIRIDDIIIKQAIIIDSAAVGPYTYRVSGNKNASSYQWMECSGDTLIAIPGATKKDFLVTQPGYYALQANYIDCTDISPCEYIYTKRLRQMSDAIEATLFPNPGTDRLNISFSGLLEECNVQILDLAGQVLFESFHRNQQVIELNISKYPAGTYILQISDKTGRFDNYKFVKL
jgi:hypothetical protein